MDRSLLFKTVMVDLDSTLSDTQHRHHLAPEDHVNGDWVSFSDACSDDGVIEGTAQLIRLLYPNNRVVICSGRNHTAYAKTEAWLELKAKVPYDELYLCNYTETPMTNGEFKVYWINKQRDLGYDPVLFIEDYVPTALAIEETGVPVLCVNPRYHPGDRKQGPGESYLVIPPRLI